MPTVSISEQQLKISVPVGTTLLDALKQNGIYPDAPCGGNGTCGMCKVFADGIEVLACQTKVDEDMTVSLPKLTDMRILKTGVCSTHIIESYNRGYVIAFDIGTTSVVCYLLNPKTGSELTSAATLNPQVAYGADVISRIQAALKGELPKLTDLIRSAMEQLIKHVCNDAGISSEEIGVVAVVGNPAMQQILLGISPENLANAPFRPVLTKSKTLPCSHILPICSEAQLLIVPNIAGFVGADTIACLLATGLHEKNELTLLVDIGTNGEMVLGNKERMLACSTAAGPALEGANIKFGMRAADGAIDHVWLENGEIMHSVIGGGKAIGICGSGLIDAVAVGLRIGLLNKRGRIQNDDHILHLADGVFLTQDDVRQVQLAKGAVCAGIVLMAKQLKVELKDIQKVQLAGAFGSYLVPENACRIDLLPEELMSKIEVVGNAAGSGAKILACDKKSLELTDSLVKKIEFLELASIPEFAKTFAVSMNFREET